MTTKEEQYLQAILDGSTDDLPQATTIEEMYLRAMATEEIEEGLPTPYTKKVELLKAILDRINEGGFSNPTTPEIIYNKLWLDSSFNILESPWSDSGYNIGYSATTTEIVFLHGLELHAVNDGIVRYGVSTPHGTTDDSLEVTGGTLNQLLLPSPIRVEANTKITYFIQLGSFGVFNVKSPMTLSSSFKDSISLYNSTTSFSVPTITDTNKWSINLLYSLTI